MMSDGTVEVARRVPAARDLSSQIRKELGRPWHGWGSGRSPRLMAVRMVARFINLASKSPSTEVATAVEAEPLSCGNRNFDAFLAGAIDLVCLRAGIDIPAWTAKDEWRTEAFWEVGEEDDTMPGGYRIAWGMAIFRRHGVLVTANDLVVV